MTRSIFKFSNDIISVCFNGVDKNNKEWTAREIQKHDIPNYEHLLSDINIMKYMYQERKLRSNEIEFRVNNEYQIRQPKGALTILDEQNNFIGFILSKPEKKSRSEIVYALSQKYWNKGIGYSVLSKMVNEWGPEVHRIGLGENLDKQNNQRIQEIFQFNGKELEQFYTTVRPKNVASWRILEKVGFKPVQAEVSIDFESKGYDLPSLDNFLKYCEKLEEFIDKLYFNENIEFGKLYIQDNDKKFTFCKNADGRIRFHYEKAI
ncbi:6279_t:CDS:1 [Cetraspora pellucida]|uniref:6279_t:CDS:1 n=1 Tax=Cetraspora pellucida TaxID=1433469 RepID=A0ACA9M4L9_9GLOM|nr:6279_t:CDS:1 [Cetraspora pellucida]